MQITKQTSLFDEIINKNGKEINVSYYVKNTPFLITLVSNTSVAKAKVDVEVVYWEDHRLVVVPFKQLDFTVHRKKEDLKTLTLEVRLHVLSSQLENAIFALQISVEGITEKIFSNACKVVSKHDQIKRRQDKAGANPEQEVRTTPAKRKRSGGEEVMGLLEDIKQGNDAHGQLLQQILTTLAPLSQHLSSVSNVDDDDDSAPSTQHVQTINKRRKISEVEDLKMQLQKANKRILELEVEVETLKLTNQNLQQTTQIFDKINSELIMDMDQSSGSEHGNWESVGGCANEENN